MKKNNWTKQIHDRVKRKKVADKAKTFNQVVPPDEE
jgi:hypothetical protein